MRIRQAIVFPLTGALLALGMIVVPPSPVSAIVVTAQLPTDNPANFTPNVLPSSNPNVHNEVDSIWQVGNTVIIGGTFQQLQNASVNGGQTYNRSSIAAINATSGAVDTNFHPVVDGDVTTVIAAGDGTSVFIAGTFNTVNGQNRRKVARVNLADGSVVSSFNTNGVDGVVRDMRLVAGELFISGLFTTVGGVPRSNLASLNPTTGAVTATLNINIVGTWNDGSTTVFKFDVTPAGDKLLMIGNFTSVGGQPRNQIAMLDLGGGPATLSPWYTTWYEATCASVFDSYMRDVDISEDGAFAVVTTTGAYRANTACDTDSRFELGNTSPTNAPTWVNYTGGDTSYAVEIHQGVAYIGGHMRWGNNPSAGDSPGQGAVPRAGMMALDVVTGLPFSWNPTRERGVGLFDYFVTADGLWAGSDTDRWNGELRQRLAFFPWSSGSLVPENITGALPDDVVLLGETSGSTGSDSSVLYRVNAGGPTLTSVDDGPDWAQDTNGSPSSFRNSGSNVANYVLTVGTVDTSVPTSDFDRPPATLWSTERWDASGGSEMQWSFPVAAGTPVQVRLFMGNKSTGTSDPGTRVFDIDIDGGTVANNLDLSASPGHNIGTMRSFNVTSDGQIDIQFGHEVENPLINGIEIIRRNVSPIGSLGQQDRVRTVVGYDGVSAPSLAGPVGGTAPWRTVRGAFMVNGTLFTLHNDGTLVRRSFDGATFGAGTSTFTYANAMLSEVNSMTGIFFDPATSRIFYTLSGQASLFSRSFLPESRVIGAIRTTATGAVGTLNPTRVRGMFVSGGQLYFGDSTAGNLLKIAFSGGVVSGVTSPVDNTIDWRARAMFLTNIAAPNEPPAAAFTQVCTDTSCAFDATDSTDADGTIANYAWDFGDGEVGAGLEPVHVYAAGGIYNVTLTVTDSDSATDVAQHAVAVVVPLPPPPPPPPPDGNGVTAGFAPLGSPTRILDTRADGTTVDAQFAAIGIRPLGSTLHLPVAGRAGVPADAKSVVLNVTVTQPEGSGFITVFPCDALQPTASSLNYVAGQTIANLVVAKIAADGTVCLFNGPATHLVVDVAGFFPGTDALTPLAAPARLLDTRSDGTTIDGISVAEGIRSAGTVQTLQVTNRAGIPAGAASVVLNVTVDQPQTAGFVTVYPCDAALPTASNVNFVAGQTIPNAVFARLSASGTICLYTSATTHVIADVTGYFADTASLVPLLAPARLLDTRSDGATIDGQFRATGLRPTGGTVQLDISGRAGIPATASAVVLNVTVDGPQGPGFITAYPADGGRPNASNLNYVAGQTVPNAVVARLGPGGKLCLFNSAATHLIVDVAGYITGPAPAETGAACPPDP